MYSTLSSSAGLRWDEDWYEKQDKINAEMLTELKDSRHTRHSPSKQTWHWIGVASAGCPAERHPTQARPRRGE